MPQQAKRDFALHRIACRRFAEHGDSVLKVFLAFRRDEFEDRATVLLSRNDLKVPGDLFGSGVVLSE